MCTFINSLPSHSKSAESPKRKNLQVFIKPSKEKEYYRFRLLAFKSPQKNDRDYPFIERYIHQHWAKDENGKSKIDGQVVCPVTKFVNVDGNRYDACPICRFANNNFLTWKESGWKDKESAKLNRQFGRKFEAIIPVYVKNDPNYDRNNGQFRVIVFSDKDFYKQFKQLIQVTSRQACCFNGKNAVDFYIHMTQVPKVVNEGLPTQYTFNQNVIDKFGFTKAESAYDIPAITKEAIDNFEFDDTYYVSSTPEELQEFYDKFIKVSNDDIPDEDVQMYTPAKKSTVDEHKNTIPANQQTEEKVEDDDIESLTKDIDDIDAETETKTSAVAESTEVEESLDTSDAELNAMIDGLDDIE